MKLRNLDSEELSNLYLGHCRSAIDATNATNFYRQLWIWSHKELHSLIHSNQAQKMKCVCMRVSVIERCFVFLLDQ